MILIDEHPPLHNAALSLHHFKRSLRKHPTSAREHESVEPIGGTRWAIAEGYIPSGSTGPHPDMTSHETACLLNAGDREAHVSITIFYFYVDRPPGAPYRLLLPAQRTLHVRFNDLNDPTPIPVDTEYASVIESDVPIVVQHTRLDSRQAEIALLSTIAFAGHE